MALLMEKPSDLEYERIEKSIENGHSLTNEMFIHSEEFLLGEIKKNPENHRAVSMLADLYHFQACRINDKAVHYAMSALRLKPDNKFDLCTLNNASNGYINDWNISCHYKLIERLKSLVQNHPNNSDRTKRFLLDNLMKTQIIIILRNVRKLINVPATVEYIMTMRLTS